MERNGILTLRHTETQPVPSRMTENRRLGKDEIAVSKEYARMCMPVPRPFYALERAAKDWRPHEFHVLGPDDGPGAQ